jgi:diguanylate cyclase (GGDEF)-like protein
MHSSLRLLLLMVLLGLQVVTLLGVFISNRIRTEALLENQAQTMMRYWAETVTDKTRSYLAPAERVGKLTRDLLESGLLNPNDKAGLESYFVRQLKENPEISGLTLGFADGSLVSARRDEKTFLGSITRLTTSSATTQSTVYDESLAVIENTLRAGATVDARERPWYIAAHAKGAPVWTDPYLFSGTKRPGLTLGVPFYARSGELLGVMGVNIALAELTNFLEGIPLSEHGAAFIVTRTGVVLASPGLEQGLVNQTAETLPSLLKTHKAVAEALWVPRMATSDHSFHEFALEGQPHYGVLNPFSIGSGATWLIGVYTPAEDFVGEFRTHDQRYLLAVLAIGIVSCLLAIPLSYRVALPLESLHRQATRDTLTHLLNRPEFLKRSEYLLEGTRRQRQTAGVVMIDLDGFKTVNDSFGHPIGDEVLTIVAQRIVAVLRPQDIVGRLGGDEFALMLANVNFDEAWHLTNRVREHISKEPVRSSRGLHEIGASVGVTLTHGTGTVADYLEQADNALLKVKATGKNRVMFVGDKGSVTPPLPSKS